MELAGARASALVANTVRLPSFGVLASQVHEAATVLSQQQPTNAIRYNIVRAYIVAAICVAVV